MVSRSSKSLVGDHGAPAHDHPEDGGYENAQKREYFHEEYALENGPND
jgi:hypothetical protein